MIIAHNMTALNIANNLNNVNTSKTKSLEKLTSGYKLNRAADNAAGLSISEKMRGQIRGLNQASMNVDDGISLTNVADGGIHEIHAILQRERVLSLQAANDTYCTEDREAIEMEIQALTNELDRMFEQTEFNTIKIFRGRDQILKGPSVTVDTAALPDEEYKDETMDKTVIWIPKTDIIANGEPQDVINNTTDVHKQYSSTYSENETPIENTDDPLHPLYKKESEYVLTTTTTRNIAETSTKYTKLEDDPTYTTLREPGNMVGNNGYINVENVARNLSLSCAMSQLGITIDGNVMDVDLYYSHNVRKSTVVSPDRQTATTTYKYFNPNFEIDQKITLTDNGTAYEIGYDLRNTDAQDHTITLRLAFDVMNTDYAHSISTTDGVVYLPFRLENDDAIIPISAPDVSDACLTDIADLYDVMDKSKVNMAGKYITHTGAGFWWNDKAMGAGGSLSLGPVKYGPIDLKKVPYEKVDETKNNIIISRETETTKTTLEYKPQYLDIQAGANTGQMIAIRLWDLTTDNLKCTTPEDISAFSPQNSLAHIDRVINKISGIRSYYGAITNRMEHAYMYSTNAAENLTNAESRIRDADMASEMVAFSKNNILSQTGASLLAQANHSNQGALNLLQ